MDCEESTIKFRFALIHLELIHFEKIKYVKNYNVKIIWSLKKINILTESAKKEED